MAGKWIVFEGLDGAGTTTQARLLAEFLRKMNSEDLVFATAEPTHGPLGQVCHAALRHSVTLDRRALALAFSADRADHLTCEDGLLFHRSKGHWIVQDRYFYSTFAYQDGDDREWLREINAPFPRPDLLIFLDTPWRLCLERIAGRGSSEQLFEKEEEMRRVAENYRYVLNDDLTSEVLIVLPGTLPAAEIHRMVIERVETV